jgi:transposase
MSSPGNPGRFNLALVESALAAIYAKGSALGARYRRIIRHRGHKKAVVAVAHAILRAADQVLAARSAYHDTGPDYSDRRYAARVMRRAVQTLERQGYRVTLERAV